MSKANNRAAADTFLAVALGVLRKSYYLCQQEETTQEFLMNSSLFVLPSSLTNMTEKQQKIAASAFAKKWEGRGYEKGESQTFWTELLTEVMGVV